MATSADQPLDTSLPTQPPQHRLRDQPLAVTGLKLPGEPSQRQPRDLPTDTTPATETFRRRLPERPAGATLPLKPPWHRLRNLPRDLLSLIRPGQWPKNLLVVPLALLDVQVAPPGLLLRTSWAVLLFILASSVVYVLNDLYDRDRDRAHPTKRHRAIASGRIGVPAAVAFGGALTLLLAGAAVYGPVDDWWPIAVYLVLNLAYSRGLKHTPLLDVFVVATGFALRVVQGHLAAGTQIRSWLLVSVFSLCLVFVLGKRRHEMSASGLSHRPSLRGYSIQYLDHLIGLCASVTVVTFLFHLQQSVGTPYADLAVLGSAPFALFAMARYLQLLHVHGGGGEPTRILLRDRAMVVNSLLWGLLLGGTLLATHY